MTQPNKAIINFPSSYYHVTESPNVKRFRNQPTSCTNYEQVKANG